VSFSVHRAWRRRSGTRWRVLANGTILAPLPRGDAVQAVSIRARSLSTSLFLKTLLALSGAGWLLFVIAHLYSNLHIFFGRESFNTYYDGLKASPAMLWGVRGMLVAGLLVHVGTSFVITRRSLESRPQ